ncbi:hypothetical protein OROHE_011380 [Orobanche hederae]
MFFKIRPSQEILKIRDGTHLEAEEILTYIKKPSKRIVARIMFFKIRPSQEILKIRDGTPFEAEEILTYIKKPSKRIEILKIRDGTHLEAEKILTYIKSPRNGSKKRVARILFFKIRPSQEILKIRDGTQLEAEEILTYIKKPSKRIVARILFFRIRPSQEILKIRDGTHLEAEEILTYIKKPSKRIGLVARIMFFKIRPSQEILKIRDGTPLEAETILTYIKSPRNGSVCYFSSKLDVPSNVVQKKRVAHILFFKIRPSQEILKVRDGTPFEAEEILTYIKKPLKQIVAQILFFKIRPSQEILKIRDGTPFQAEEILTYIKKPSKRIGLPSQEILKIRDGTQLEEKEILTYIKKPSKRIANVPSSVVQKKRVAQIHLFKIKPSQEILKIRDGTPFETEEILTYIKKPLKQIVAEEILPYIKSPRNGSICYFSIKLDVPSSVVQKKRVAQIHLFKIKPSQEILKIRDGTPLEAEEILTYIKKPSKQIVAEEILPYIKCPRNGSICYFSIKLDVPSNVLQKKRVSQIYFFKIRPSQEILKIRDGTPLEAEEILTYIKSPRNGSICYFSIKLNVPSNVLQKKRVSQIHFFKIRPSQEILKIRDGTPFEAEEILTYIKKPSKRIGLLLF